MKQALTAFLILSLLGGQVAMIGALLARRHVRQRRPRRIAAVTGPEHEQAAVQHLALSRSARQSPGSSFVRIEDREFRYRGHLYDVVRDEWRGSVWHVWVIRDHQEEHYLDVLAQVTGPSTLEGTAVSVHQSPLGVFLRALLSSAWGTPPSPQVRAQSLPRFSIAAHQAPFLEVPHPPPWG